jgi:signal transduction histidine kinase
MAVLFTTLLGLAALILAYFLYDFGRKNFLRETQAVVDREMEDILLFTQNISPEERIRYIQTKATAANGLIYYLQSKDEKRLAGNMASLPVEVSRLSEGMIGFEQTSPLERLHMAAKIHTYPEGQRLLVARDISDIVKNHRQLKFITVLVIGFMAVVVIVSFLISIFVVGRINMIAAIAREIMETGDLSRRIAIDGNWDDLSNLAQILNDLLDKIESLMQGIRDVSDNIAHDLRTPLTRLRNHLEHMQSGDITPQERREVLVEADAMLDTFHALLRIANIEKGKRYQAFDHCDIAILLHDVIELYEPLAEEKSVTLATHIAEHAPYFGDRDLLFQAFANLLDNALKYAPPLTAIEITLHSDGAQHRITLADQGKGVPPEEIPKLFDRFYRADKSRSSKGSGLGLSLVKAILDLHKAAITLTSNTPGLRVEIRL